MRKIPLVSINIPTLNSDKTLERTLISIKNQTYRNYEIIIIDNGSKDSTVKIAKKYTKKIFLNRKKLLGSRYIGVTKSKGKIIILLDSDQILEGTTIERCVKLIKSNRHDMLFLEENSYNPKTTIEKLSSIDRKITHKKRIINPSKSVLLPRVFKAELIKKAFTRIDPKLFDVVSLQDHAIIYFECYNLSTRLGYLKSAVLHEEPSTICELFKHYFGWGVKVAEKLDYLPLKYKKMFSNKIKSRGKSIEFMSLNFPLALPVIFIKAMSYYLGILNAKLKRI